ncbi:MAG: hypothetical protein QOJ59_3270, partial [Thermomicrobiales bacterium]|nr:hypothetical protein [Thermomicrobiales bacterium]
GGAREDHPRRMFARFPPAEAPVGVIWGGVPDRPNRGAAVAASRSSTGSWMVGRWSVFPRLAVSPGHPAQQSARRPVVPVAPASSTAANLAACHGCRGGVPGRAPHRSPRRSGWTEGTPPPLVDLPSTLRVAGQRRCPRRAGAVYPSFAAGTRPAVGLLRSQALSLLMPTLSRSHSRLPNPDRDYPTEWGAEMASPSLLASSVPATVDWAIRTGGMPMQDRYNRTNRIGTSI